MQSGVDPARDAAREAAAWFRSADGQSIRSFFREQGAAGAIVVTESAVLLFFMRLSLAPLGRRLAAVLPARRCARLRLLARDVRRGVLGYLVVMVAMNAGLAAALALSLAAFDVAQPLVWAGAVFALVFIPYLGPLAAVGLLLVVGAARFGPTAAMAAPAAAFLLLHGIEANLISPWFTARKLQTSRVAVLVAVLAGTWAWGVVGGLLAMPLLIAAQLALARTNSSPVLSALLEADLAS
jgi:predicted PurR-regulated permease PerM